MPGLLNHKGESLILKICRFIPLRTLSLIFVLNNIIKQIATRASNPISAQMGSGGRSACI